MCQSSGGKIKEYLSSVRQHREIGNWLVNSVLVYTHTDGSSTSLWVLPKTLLVTRLCAMHFGHMDV